MEPAFLFRIGPFDGGLQAFFLWPRGAGPAAHLAPSLAAALPELRRAAGRPLVCEPALAAEAGALGLPLAPWPAEARSLLAAMAFDLGARGAFGGITRPGLIWRFGCAAAAFAGIAPPRHGQVEEAGRPPRPVVLTEGPGLVLLEEEGATDGLAMIFAQTEPAVADALDRAFGLAALPEPFRLHRDTKLPVTEAELALLTVALTAAAAGGGRAHLEVEGVTADVALTFAP